MTCAGSSPWYRTPYEADGTAPSCSPSFSLDDAALEVLRPDGRQSNRRGWHLLLRVPRQGRQAWTPRAPRPAYDAIVRTLEDRGKELATMAPDESLWRITSSTFYSRFQRYLAAAGLYADGPAYLEAQRGQAASRCRRVNRGREPVPRPQLVGGHHGVPPAPRRCRGPRVAGCGGRYRPVGPCGAGGSSQPERWPDGIGASGHRSATNPRTCRAAYHRGCG